LVKFAADGKTILPPFFAWIIPALLKVPLADSNLSEKGHSGGYRKQQSLSHFTTFAFTAHQSPLVS
jgi:hypothetical protein